MSLHTVTIGPFSKQHSSGDAQRIVLVHGFTQNGQCWEPLASLLAENHEVVLIDAPGHGLSAHDDAGLDEAGRLILAAGGRATYVGYSMGGRMLLHAALADSEVGVDAGVGSGLIERLVLIGATGGLDLEQERQSRRQADEVLAASLEEHGLEAFLDRWLALPLFATLDEASAARAERRTNRVSGLAASLRSCGTGAQQPLWDRLCAISVPVSLLAGEQDNKFGALADRLAQSIGPNAHSIRVPGGHAVHLEAPQLVLPYLVGLA